MKQTETVLPEATEQAPGMVFPSEIGVKIFINNDPKEEVIIRDFVTEHLNDQHLNNWSSRESSGGKYLAITARVDAQSREHIDALYQALHAHERVIMIL